MARPTKLDDLRAKRILDAVKAGNSLASAAQGAGVAPSTLHHWRERGARGEAQYLEFSERLEKARAEAEAKMVGIIRKAAELGTWQAAAWWLERRRAKAWARKDIEAERERGAARRGSASPLTHAEIQELRAELDAEEARMRNEGAG